MSNIKKLFILDYVLKLWDFTDTTMLFYYVLDSWLQWVFSLHSGWLWRVHVGKAFNLTRPMLMKKLAVYIKIYIYISITYVTIVWI